MLRHLQALAQRCSIPSPSVADIEEACHTIEAALDASDAYVIRAGDPAFVRMGCDCPPDTYEIKQRGYWLVWKELATSPDISATLFNTAGRLVMDGNPIAPGLPCTHLATILSGDESNSDLLVVRGPWPDGLSAAQACFVEAARPSLSLLVANVLDTGRRARQHQQLESLAAVSDAFNRAQEGDNVLTAIATALARASGIDWVTLLTFSDAGDAITDRGMNIARHSQTDTAAVFQGPRSAFAGGELRVGKELAARDQYIAIPDVFADNLADDPGVALLKDDLPGLQRYWRRAHILSMAMFPIAVQGQALGSVAFSSTTARAFEPAEVEFLRALVSQAASAIKGIRLLQALRASQEDLRRSEERFRSLVQNASDLITVIDDDTTVLYQSPSIAAVLGYHASEVVGRQLIDLVHADDLALARDALRQTATAGNGRVGGEIRVRHRDGSWRLVEFVGADQRANPAIGGFVLNIRDVSERKALEQQLRHQALHDPLTRLANRTRFVDALQRAVFTSQRTGTNLAVLFMDLDNFKGVNDSLGHAVGDDLLTQVAERVQDCLRPGDTVARLGGDEFAMLIEGVSSPAEAARVGSRILACLDRPFRLDGKDLVVRASVGIAIGGPGGASSDADTLLRYADVAMYAAKSGGKGRYELFREGMQESMMDKLELLGDLHNAIDRGEFILHYQPMIHLETGSLYGLEALVRWQHPRRGLVPPGEFIPLAEESGAIIRLGQMVLREGCRQAVAWAGEHPALSAWALSINVSARQLQHPEFVAGVASTLEETGLPPERLLLELTETAMMQDLPVVAGRLNDLKSIGVRLALDDFGTGHSSLSYLRELPFDILKIDKSFIADMGAVPPNRELARAIIELGNALQIELMAEGIERADQLSRLKALHCEMGQGFYFARPMDGAAIETLLGDLAAGRPLAADAA